MADLLARFRAADARAKAALISELEREPAAVAAPVLIAALDEPSSVVRSAAARAVAWVKPGTALGPLVRAFASVEARLAAEHGRVEPATRRLEEEDLLRALRALAAAGGVTAGALTSIAPRVLAIASDEDAYDPGSHVSAGLYAAELLAEAGVPRSLLADLEAAREAPGLKTAVTALLDQALARSR